MGILRDTSPGNGRYPDEAPDDAPGALQAAEGSHLPVSANESASARAPMEAHAPREAHAPAGPLLDGGAELRRRRDALAQQVAELHWDLGGLAYEMAIRDHFRLDVLVRRAAVLQERDAELAEIERLLRMQHEGASGSCPGCGAPHSRGAGFCWQCGGTLLEQREGQKTLIPHGGEHGSGEDATGRE